MSTGVFALAGRTVRIGTPLFALLAAACSTGDADVVVLNIDGRVNDYAADMPLEGASVTLYTWEGSYLGEAETDSEGQWGAKIAVPYDNNAGVKVHAYVEAEGYVNTDLYEKFYVRDPEASALTLEPAHRIEPADAFVSAVNMVPNSGAPGSFEGRIFDAFQSDEAFGLGGLPLILREGINPPEDAPIIASTVTSGNGDEQTETTGYFVFEALPPGTYTVFVDGGNAYMDFNYAVAVVGGERQIAQNAGTTVPMEDNQARVVLSWGDAPANLDLHVSGTVDQGAATAFLDEERWQIWAEQTAYPVDSGPDSAKSFLNIFDDDGFGPETATIRDFDKGTYRISVHDWTNKADKETEALSHSLARVQLWVGKNYRAYDVPVGEFGTVWTVFEIDGANQRYFPVNAFSFEEDPTRSSSF